MTRSAILGVPALLFLCAGVAFGGASAGCGLNYLDPCQRLAYRICSCEATQSQQRTCEQDRIQAQQDSVTPTAEEPAVCTEALNTCTCTELDDNRTDLCGFTREAPSSGDDEPVTPGPSNPAGEPA